jgi:hypothetical protein
MIKFLYEIFQVFAVIYWCYYFLNYIFKKYKKYKINQYRFFLKVLRQSKSLKDQLVKM